MYPKASEMPELCLLHNSDIELRRKSSQDRSSVATHLPSPGSWTLLAWTISPLPFASSCGRFSPIVTRSYAIYLSSCAYIALPANFHSLLPLRALSGVTVLHPQSGLSGLHLQWCHCLVSPQKLRTVATERLGATVHTFVAAARPTASPNRWRLHSWRHSL